MVTNIQNNPITIWDIINTFKDKLSDEDICQLEKMLEEFESDTMLKLSNTIYRELSNLINQVNDEVMYSREKPNRRFE